MQNCDDYVDNNDAKANITIIHMTHNNKSHSRSISRDDDNAHPRYPTYMGSIRQPAVLRHTDYTKKKKLLQFNEFKLIFVLSRSRRSWHPRFFVCCVSKQYSRSNLYFEWNDEVVFNSHRSFPIVLYDNDMEGYIYCKQFNRNYWANMGL